MTAFITTAQAAAAHGISRAQVWRMAQAGSIPGAVKIGRQWAIPPDWAYTRRQSGWPKGKLRKPNT